MDPDRRPATSRLAFFRVLLDLPVLALSVAVVLFIVHAAGFAQLAWLAVVVWLAAGLLLFDRHVEDWIVARLRNVRAPSPAEAGRLTPAWERVTGRAGLASNSFRHWVTTSRGINAEALAGHSVAATQLTARALDGEQLEAVLAHELGHHLGGHSWASLLRWWYSVPGYAATGFASYLALALRSALLTGSIGVLILVAALEVAGVAYLSFLFLIPVLGIIVCGLVTSSLLTLWITPQQEYQADRFAAELGYGPALVDFLQRVEPSGRSPATRLSGLARTHPDREQRVRRLTEAAFRSERG